MSHALICHLPAALASLIGMLALVRFAFLGRQFSDAQLVALCSGAVVASLSIVGALHV